MTYTDSQIRSFLKEIGLHGWAEDTASIRGTGVILEAIQAGRVPEGPGSRPAGQAPSGLDASRFDPSRERVRVILDCEWGDLQHALELVIDAKPTFDGHPKRPGWGWRWYRRGGPSMFVRQTKHGYSAMADRRDSDGSPKGGDGEAGSVEDDSAVPERQSPKDSQLDARMGDG